jgi:lipopolysaccharide transport system permease protein
MRAVGRINAVLAPWVILSSFLRKIYIQHYLIRNLVVRDLRARYIGSFMGFFWSVINPVILITSYSFVFMVVLNIGAPQDSGTRYFPLFLFCNILPWLFFQDTLQRSSTVIIDNANLITKTVFPTEVLPLAILLSGLVNHLIGCAILLFIMVAVGHPISLYALWVPVYLFFLMLFTLGLSWFVSSLNVFVRDISQVLTAILTFWFWFTPIFYMGIKVPAKYAFVSRLNPLAHVVTGYRDCLLRMEMPDLQALAWFAGTSVVIFVTGGLFFRQIKREFVDVL